VCGIQNLYILQAQQPHNSDSVFTISQKCIFNVNHIDTSCGKFIIFSGDGTDKKYRSDFTKMRHFKRKIHFFLGGA